VSVRRILPVGVAVHATIPPIDRCWSAIRVTVLNRRRG
jgi:hypothetical protein